MNILVTGGAGFIGSHIVDKLLELGHTVTVLDDLSTGDFANISDKAMQLEVNLFTIPNKDLQCLLQDVDYVFHLATIPRIVYTIEHPLESHDANVTGTIKLLEACKKNNVRKVILSSTYCVYGQPDNLPMTEDECIKPPTPYAVQKYMQEMYVKMYSQLYNVPSVILRYFTVYGDRQSSNGAYPNLLGAFRKQKQEQGYINITGDGLQTRDFVHVSDVVTANILAMDSDFKNAEVFNIGTGKATTVHTVAKYFNCEIRRIENRPAEIKHVVCDNQKSYISLKWFPKILFEEGIKGLIN